MKFLSPPPEDTKGHEKGFQMLAPPCFGAKDKGGVKDGRGRLVGSSAVPQPAKTNDGSVSLGLWPAECPSWGWEAPKGSSAMKREKARAEL